MKVLKCKDVGMACEYVAKGMTEGEVMDTMMKHAAAAHKDMMEKMTEADRENLMGKLRQAIREE